MAPSSIRVLVINPNSTTAMTDALKPVVTSLGYENIEFEYFTCPAPGIPSINSPEDARKSAVLCLQSLVPLIVRHDVFLVACYSEHPLVHMLKSQLDNYLGLSDGKITRKYVTGIFEASVSASLNLTGSQEKEGFGIVSTGKVWEDALKSGVENFVGAKDIERFLGCETTGLNASELHELPADVVNQKMKEATMRLLQKGKAKGVQVKAICLGCAGMVGLEDAVRQACMAELGPDGGKQVSIVDGVKAGIGSLISLARGGF